MKEKIWGGSRLGVLLNKDVDSALKIGESWEISGIPGETTMVSEGPLKGRLLSDLLTEFNSSLVGEKIYHEFGDTFPLLIKFIDANDDLSVQVHPDDQLAMNKHGCPGKTEMWYIMHAEKDATLISGFSKSLNQEEFLNHIQQDTVMEVLNREAAKKDDYFYIPAGRVHTIGRGILLAEIQQPSDVTYRIYDFNRLDEYGNSRPLHHAKAIEALDFNLHENYKMTYTGLPGTKTTIVDSPFFTTRVLNYRKPVTRRFEVDSFHILMGIEGEGTIVHAGSEYALGIGTTILIPAVIRDLVVEPAGSFKWIETFIRK